MLTFKLVWLVPFEFVAESTRFREETASFVLPVITPVAELRLTPEGKEPETIE